MLAKKVRYWLLWGWFCLESGEFIESHSHWGQESLFWPFWGSLFLAMTLIVEFASNWYDKKEIVEK